MTKATGRIADCDSSDAASRLAQARSFLEAAELFEEADEPEAAHVVASNAVLAAIAASDAACCAALGYRSVGQAHEEAVRYVGTVSPGGKAAAAALRRVLAIKSKSQYGLTSLRARDRDTALTQARKLIAFAENVLAR
jgi:hypothetical protein